MEMEHEMMWLRNREDIGVTLDEYLNIMAGIIPAFQSDTRQPDMMIYLLGRDKLGVYIPGKLIVMKVVGNKYRYKLLVERSATKVLSISVSWTFSNSGTVVSTGSNTFTVPRGTGLYCLEGEIAISASQLSTNLIMNVPSDVLSAALCPDGIEFELTSLDGKGNVVCRTGRDGIIESREYDPQGRLLRAKDKNGNILQEYHYHVQPSN